MDYIAPEINKRAFTCPNCGVYSNQKFLFCIDSSWHNDIAHYEFGVNAGKDFHFGISICDHCKRICIWRYDQVIYPNRGNAPIPNPDMPEDVREDYEEAAGIYTQSPRGASALLRIAIQKLSIHLGGSGKNLNDDIAELVKKGLPEKIQKSLDIVRVIGNHAVHPGQINVDNVGTATKLFTLVNLITDYMVSMPRKVNEMYSGLPNFTKDVINKRDHKKT
jgi:hypothetical protein